MSDMVGGVSGVGSVNAVSQVSNAGRTAKVAATQNQPAITPVARTATVQKERLNPVEYQLPQAQEGVDPQEMAVRSRIGTTTEEVQLKGQLATATADLEQADLDALEESSQERVEEENQGICECCRNRRYQDGSNDTSVSFQTPTHISPEASGARVMAHEQEHVGNEQSYAAEAGAEVRSQSVEIQQSVCPECGKTYTSGGKTTTVTAEQSETAPVENKISLSSQSVDRLMAVSGA